MRYILLSALLLTGCGRGFHTKHDPRAIHGVNPVFQPYIAQYLSYKGSSLSYDIPIQFADLNGSTVGLCTRWSTGERQIEIDYDYWTYSFDENDKLETIIHELGHCDLNRGHESAMVDGAPVSLMYPYVFSLLTEDISRYMKELFDPYIFHAETVTSCVKDIKVQ